jgi:ABC-type lipoprotein release transport system permease subunit
VVPVIYNVRSLAARRVTTVVTALGVGLVVFVFAAALMLRHGLDAAVASTGRPDNATAYRDGANNDVDSSIERGQADILCARPEVQVGADGKPLCTKELATGFVGNRADGSGTTNIQVRGMDDESLAVHSEVQVIDGRAPSLTAPELMVGRAIAGRFEGLTLGGTLHWQNEDWTVVGIFSAAGSSYESQLWGSGEQLMQALQRPAFSTVTMRLANPSTLDAMAAQIHGDPQTKSVIVTNERGWYANQAWQLAAFISIMGIAVAIIFAIGATIGAAITMYAQVASRVREIGVMRALGFRRRSVLLSFLIEAMLLSLLGGGIGLLGATAMGLVTFSTLNWQTFSEMSFRFTPTPQVYVSAIIFTVVMGFLGGFLPAWRAARLSPLEAMRSE